jgi:hypothetical protein
MKLEEFYRMKRMTDYFCVFIKGAAYRELPQRGTAKPAHKIYTTQNINSKALSG